MAILQLHDGYADLESLKVSRGGRFEALTRTEARLLRYLFDRAGETVSREELLRAVWGYREGVRSRTLDTYLWRLRRKLEPDPTDPRLLLTEARQGILLQRLPPPPAEDAGEGVIVSLLALDHRLGTDSTPGTAAPDAAWQALRAAVLERADAHGLTPHGDDPPGQLTLVGIAAEPALDVVLAVLAAHAPQGGLQAGLERVRWAARRRAAVLEDGQRRARRLALLAFPGSALASLRFARALPPRRMQTIGQLPLLPGEPAEPLLSPLPPAEPQILAPLDVVVFGRQAELDALTAAVVGSSARLISVVGASGIGKSTLAHAWVERALEAEQLDAVLACELGPAATAADLPQALARTLEVSADRLEGALAARGAVLILLDRAESVLPAAAEQLARWLAAAPESRWLLTATAPTGLPGEAVVPVGPLSPQAAAALLLDRVAGLPGYRELAPSDALVGELVETIGCTPLALELASTRARLLRPAQLLARLREDPEALQATRAPGEGGRLDGAVAFTWSLLPEAARAGVARLATFPADFSMEAAEAVLADQDGSPVARIEELADASLLRLRDAPRLDDIRLQLPAPVRAFALRRLAPEDARQARIQAARWLVQASTAWLADASWGPRQYEGLQRLRAEQHNLLSAFDTLDTVDPEAALRLLVACKPLLEMLQTVEPQALLERLERLATAALPEAGRQEAGWLRCSLLVRIQRYAEADALADALLTDALAPRYQDEVRLLQVLARFFLGRSDAAAAGLEALRPLFLVPDLPPWRLSPSVGVGILYSQLPGGMDTARAVIGHALQAAEALGSALIIDRLSLFLAKCDASDGVLPVEALPGLLARCQRLSDSGARAVAQPHRLNLARAQLALQGPEAARPTLTEVRRQATLAGDTFELDNIDLVMAELHLLADELPQARAVLEGLIARARAHSAQLRLRRSLQRLALLELLDGAPVAGLAALAQASGDTLTAFDRYHHTCIAAALHAQAGDLEAARAELSTIPAPPSPRAAAIQILAAAWLVPATQRTGALPTIDADATARAAGNSGSIQRILTHGLRQRGTLRVFLDDERPTPPGWVPARWPEEVIALLQTGAVAALSLDHDLGDDDHGTGYDVVVWLEEAVATRGFVPPAELRVHSANSSARQKMEAGVRQIFRLARRPG